MDVEFDSAARRFARDHSARSQAAAAKREKLRAEREAARRRTALREEAKAAEEMAAATLAAAEAERRAHDLERNRGVYFHQMLRPTLSRAAEQRGIVRAMDKVQLPPSASAALADASHNGIAAFEITAPNGASTHATLLDFTAPEGAIGMPEPVLRMLGLAGAPTMPEASGDDSSHALLPPLPAAVGGGGAGVTVRYRRLPRGTFARVQPVASRFRREVDDVKALLEAELMRRTTLSVNDTIVVGGTGVDDSDGGAEGYAIRVLALEPEGAVSLIDTDLEVEIAPSLEEEEALAAARAAEQRAAEVAEAARAAAAAAQVKAAEEAAAQQEAAASAAAAALEERCARRERAQEALPAEPAAGGMLLSVRCPDGARCVRRFEPTAPLEAAFALVEASWVEAVGAPLLPPAFALVAQFPRRVFSREGAAAVTLEQAGLGAAHEALLVEIPTG
mmetsp:Transcript_20246/g.57062  ORF Transcript_20246/g.57062 Transcript_20246/m.57062 type:complete len:449 (-) Transcript_20246:222-1568(-)